MARVSVLNNAAKSAGTYPFGPFSIVGTLISMTFDVDVTDARTGDDLTWVAQFSLDNGATWPMTTQGTLLGGTPKRLDGSAPAATLISTETVLLPPGANRLVKGSVSITGATRKIPVGVRLA